MDKYEVAQILREIGMIIELIDANPKKGLAYRKAAHTIESLNGFSKIINENSLTTLPGIGPNIAQMVITLVQKGSLSYYEKLRNQIPNSLFQLMYIPGLTLRKLRILYEKFNISNFLELENVLKSEKIRDLKEFSPSYTKKILKQISLLSKQGYSLLYPQASHIAQAFVELLKNISKQLAITGSLRRKSELVHQLDFLATTDNKDACLSLFIHYGLVKNILSKEENYVSVLLKNEIKATLHIVEESEFSFVLLNTTGNQGHLEELQKEALKQGYQLKKYSIQPINKNQNFKNEQNIYQFLGIPFIPPELREGYGEIDAVKKNKLLPLIEYKDLHGAFHCHTVYSDGQNTLEELVIAAQQLGWEYIGISDHSKSSYQAHGMDEERLLEQIKQIDQLNHRIGPAFHIFSGVECDILKDGSLDFDADILRRLDFVIVSIHRFFNLEEEIMTKRLIKAIENPYSTIIGHLTGRLLRHRDAYHLNIPKILDACVANDKIIELNAYPSRLDMDWRWWIKAKEKGLKCCINPDAHSLKDLKNCAYGVDIARKGWLGKNDVINTLTLKEMISYLERRKKNSD